MTTTFFAGLDAGAFRGADLSPCGRFRWTLWRAWDLGLPLLAWVMLNPSTADADTDDHTITKVCEFTRLAGFGGMLVVNLYAYRATDPKALKAAGWPVGAVNDDAILAALARSADTVVCAWGTNVRGMDRPKRVASMLQRAGASLVALRTTADGIPCHPLMLPYSCSLQLWPPAGATP